MPNTFELIASSTVGAGGAANIDFTSIPATYTDLCVKVSARHDANVTGIRIQYNGSTSSFFMRYVYGSGSAASSGADTTQYAYGNSSTYTASTFGNSEFYIPNYAGSNNKSLSSDSVTENNATAADMLFGAGLWSNTAAITSIKLSPTSGNFVQYSTAYLYGVKNA